MSVNLHKLFIDSVILSCALCTLSVNSYGKDKAFYKFTKYSNISAQAILFRNNSANNFPTTSNSKAIAKSLYTILKKCGFKHPQAYIPTQENSYKNATLVWSDKDIHVTGLLFGRVHKDKSSEIIQNLTLSWGKQCSGWFGRKSDENFIYKSISVETTYFACITDNNTSFDSIILFKTPHFDSIIWQWSKSSEENLRRTTELIKIRIPEVLDRRRSK